MSQFRFKEYLYNLLPLFFHDSDTYKNQEGKGILQRFLEVCSEYLDIQVLDDRVTHARSSNPNGDFNSDFNYDFFKGDPNIIQPGLDNIVDLIDIDKTPELFLNYIWEFLGEIPYAYGLIIQGKTYNQSDLTGWLKDVNFFPKTKTRALLKYAISLYRIRGTSLFYEILGRFYGVNLQLIETNALGIETTDLINDRLFLAAYDTNALEISDTKYYTKDGFEYVDIIYDNVPQDRLRFYIRTHDDYFGTHLPTGVSVKQYYQGNLEYTYHLTSEPGYKSFDIHPQVDRLVITSSKEMRTQIYKENEEDLTVAVYPRGLEEIRAPYRDNNCTSCLYFKLVIGFDHKTYDNLVSDDQLDMALDLLGSLVSKYLPIQVKLVSITYTVDNESS